LRIQVPLIRSEISQQRFAPLDMTETAIMPLAYKHQSHPPQPTSQAPSRRPLEIGAIGRWLSAIPWEFKMVRGHDHPPNWAVLPGASVTAELTTPDWSKKPVIEIRGNREGLLSLGSLLVWVSESAADLESFSITGLPFVQAQSALSLVVVQSLDTGEPRGRLIHMDKAQQFEWQVHEDILEREAICIMRVGFCRDGCCCDHAHGDLGPNPDIELFIARTDMR
jgi:hypothetical protein